MTEELKQAAQQALMECPFCGSEPHDAHHIEYGRWAVTCRCGAKGASANTGPNATDAAKIKAYSDARTAWNTRALAQRPAEQAGEVDIKSRVSELIAEHGTLRAAARSLNIDVGYLSRLEHGDKVHPSSETLAKIGLRDAGVKYQRLVFLPTQPAAQATPKADPLNPGWCVGCNPDNCSGCGIGLNEAKGIAEDAWQARASLPTPPAAQATPEPDEVARLVASIKDDAKHAAYLAEIDNTDGRDNHLHKLSISLDDLASRVHHQATPEPSRGMIGTGAHALANELAQAVAQDDADPDGHDMSAGLFGPNVSAWLRKISADYLPQPATPEPVGEPEHHRQAWAALTEACQRAAKTDGSAADLTRAIDRFSDVLMGDTHPAPGVPEIDYQALIHAAWGKHKYAQGTGGCIAFKRGAEWFRDIALAAAQAKGVDPEDLAAAGVMLTGRRSDHA